MLRRVLYSLADALLTPTDFRVIHTTKSTTTFVMAIFTTSLEINLKIASLAVGQLQAA